MVLAQNVLKKAHKSVHGVMENETGIVKSMLQVMCGMIADAAQTGDGVEDALVTVQNFMLDRATQERRANPVDAVMFAAVADECSEALAELANPQPVAEPVFVPTLQTFDASTDYNALYGAYERNMSTACPFCQYDCTTGGGVEFNGNEVTQDVSCSNCLSVWTDVFTLSRIENAFVPTPFTPEQEARIEVELHCIMEILSTPPRMDMLCALRAAFAEYEISKVAAIFTFIAHHELPPNALLRKMVKYMNLEPVLVRLLAL